MLEVTKVVQFDTCQHYIRERVKLNHFDYHKGKIVPGVNLGCPVLHGDYLHGKIGQLRLINLYAC